tara:strand:+ start:421 stop:1413 length:993 start_codon:yes stop_codon:yes gene_type:complete
MAYIGKPPISGNFQVCDAISVVNGQAAYTMQVSSANVSPETANHMLVSLNGVLQKPGSSFTISGSTITFASNLATGDVIDFILLLGNVNDIGTPSDSTVTNAKTNFTTTSSAAGLQIKGDGTTAGALQLNCEQNSHGIKLQSPAHSANQSYTLKFPTGNVTADKVLKVASVSGSGTTGVGQLSFGDAGGTNTPSFQAYRTATQSLSNNVWTKIQNNVELFDTDGAYDHSTNYRFTIPSGKAGKYVILVAVNIHDLGDGKYVQSAIYKNGSVIKEDIVSAGRTIPTSVKTITIDDASVGDYYEAYVKNRNDSTRDLNYAYGNVFYGYKLIT